MLTIKVVMEWCVMLQILSNGVSLMKNGQILQVNHATFAWD
jgi:hypothetical protein